MNETGGVGSPQLKGLSAIENRFLGILGPTFYKGVGRLEHGLSSFGISKPNIEEMKIGNLPSTSPSTSSQNNISSQDQTSDIPIASSSQKEICIQQQVPVIETVAPKRQLLEDHDYLKAPMQNPKRFKSKNEDPMETIYRETLSELKEIRVCLQDLMNSNRGIHLALQEIASKMCKE
ncbi:unnamed protein product [Ceutorhynchus assimilis]|uniref:Uncharacterized protein n=1 Tax=Ceutorhynchus assimilis TaxID=467358 RepID=A0A9N9MZD4_9CUCU|nr:unnamed protein product [Ceutorhynchus assimilis]